ncbi:MAG: response regulator [Roseiflexaceae bacterium]|nr:response regulator [Roseiflexaceae bacterium]
MARPIILIVDDTPDHCELLRRLLQVAGYQVVVAATGSEAIAQAQQTPPDLILAALSLPGQPAWEAARQLRSVSGLETTPMLGTTVFTTLLTGPRVRAIGCADFVEKPFDFDTLLYRIGQLMPRHLQYEPV